MDRRVEKVRSEAKEYLGDISPSHDWKHVERVEELAEKLCNRKEKADKELVKLAVLLHDIGRGREDRGEIEDHSSWGAKEAEKILSGHNFEKEIIEKVKHCIDAHRYSKDPEPKSVEAKILSDADNLDAIGATGIARTFCVAGERENTLADPDLPAEEDSSEVGETALNHFYKKIFDLKDRMYTKEGEEIAEERHKFTKKFVERMENEIRGET